MSRVSDAWVSGMAAGYLRLFLADMEAEFARRASWVVRGLASDWAEGLVAGVEVSARIERPRRASVVVVRVEDLPEGWDAEPERVAPGLVGSATLAAAYLVGVELESIAVADAQPGQEERVQAVRAAAIAPLGVGQILKANTGAALHRRAGWRPDGERLAAAVMACHAGLCEDGVVTIRAPDGTALGKVRAASGAEPWRPDPRAVERVLDAIAEDNSGARLAP